MCDMTHSYVWRDSFICVTWLIHTCDNLIHMCDKTRKWRASCCDCLIWASLHRLWMVSRDRCVALCCSVLRCFAVCCSTLQYVAVRCSTLQYVAVCWGYGWSQGTGVLHCVAVCCSKEWPTESCHTCEWVMSQLRCVTNVNESCLTYEWVMSRIRMRHVTHTKCHVTHMNESRHTYE